MKLLKAALNQLSNSTNRSGKHSFIIKKEVISPDFYLFIWNTWLMGNNPRQWYLVKELVPGSCRPGGSRAIPTPAAHPSSPPASTRFSHLPGVDPVTGEQVWLFQSTNWRAGSPRLFIRTANAGGKSLRSPCASGLPAQNTEENFMCLHLNVLSRAHALCLLY